MNKEVESGNRFNRNEITNLDTIFLNYKFAEI